MLVLRLGMESRAGQLTDGEILMLYLRLERKSMAIKTPVQTTTVEAAMAGLVLDVSLLNEDLKALNNLPPARGVMLEGVWNVFDTEYSICFSDETGHVIPGVDGVFEKYDDGIDMSGLDRELAGVSARSGLDLSSLLL